MSSLLPSISRCVTEANFRTSTKPTLNSKEAKYMNSTHDYHEPFEAKASRFESTNYNPSIKTRRLYPKDHSGSIIPCLVLVFQEQDEESIDLAKTAIRSTRVSLNGAQGNGIIWKIDRVIELFKDREKRPMLHFSLRANV